MTARPTMSTTTPRATSQPVSDRDPRQKTLVLLKPATAAAAVAAAEEGEDVEAAKEAAAVSKRAAHGRQTRRRHATAASLTAPRGGEKLLAPPPRGDRRRPRHERSPPTALVAADRERTGARRRRLRLLLLQRRVRAAEQAPVAMVKRAESRAARGGPVGLSCCRFRCRLTPWRRMDRRPSERRPWPVRSVSLRFTGMPGAWAWEEEGPWPRTASRGLYPR